MPLARLIFFEDPRELTEAQIEEARSLGHLIEDEPPAPPAAPAPVPAVAAAAEAGGTAVTETSTDES